jgi:hypothetical protein
MGLAEALASVVLATIVLMGVFNSSFIALSSTAQTEQSFDAENLTASALAELRENHNSLGVPYQSTDEVKERAAEYRVHKELKTLPGYPYCAEAIVTVTWKQGRLDRKRVQKTVIALKNQAGTGSGMRI